MVSCYFIGWLETHHIWVHVTNDQTGLRTQRGAQPPEWHMTTLRRHVTSLCLHLLTDGPSRAQPDNTRHLHTGVSKVENRAAV